MRRCGSIINPLGRGEPASFTPTRVPLMLRLARAGHPQREAAGSGGAERDFDVDFSIIESLLCLLRRFVHDPRTLFTSSRWAHSAVSLSQIRLLLLVRLSNSPRRATASRTVSAPEKNAHFTSRTRIGTSWTRRCPKDRACARRTEPESLPSAWKLNARDLALNGSRSTHEEGERLIEPRWRCGRRGDR
jgi:hypothetical protein